MRLTCRLPLLALMVALTLCLMIPTAAHALRGTIILGGPKEGWPPFFIPGTASRPAMGIMPEVLRTAANSLGFGVIEAYYPEKRGLLQLSEGGLDAWPKSVKWVADPGKYLWTDQVVMSTDLLVFRREKPVAYCDPNDLKGQSICVVHGYSYPTLDELFDQGFIHRQNAPTARHMLRMLGRGHVDGAVCNRFVADWILREDEELTPEDFAYGDIPIDSTPYGFAFTRKKNWEGFIADFNRELAAMRSDGRLDAILSRYK